MHPERPNPYAVACRDYVGDNDFAMEPMDYTAHDERRLGGMVGFAEPPGVIVDVQGTEAVDAMPELMFWSDRPEVGQTIGGGYDLFACAYSLYFRHDGGLDRTLEIDRTIRDSIRIVTEPRRSRAPGATARTLGPRMTRKAQWLAHRAATRARR